MTLPETLHGEKKFCAERESSIGNVGEKTTCGKWESSRSRSFVRSPPLGPICALSHTLTLRLRAITHFHDLFNKLVADLIAEILKDLLRLSLEYLDRSRQNPRITVLSLSLLSYHGRYPRDSTAPRPHFSLSVGPVKVQFRTLWPTRCT